MNPYMNLEILYLILSQFHMIFLRLGQRIVLDFTNNYLDATIIHPTSIMGPNDFKPGLNCQSMIDIANQKRLLNIDFGYNLLM